MGPRRRDGRLVVGMEADLVKAAQTPGCRTWPQGTGDLIPAAAREWLGHRAAKSRQAGHGIHRPGRAVLVAKLFRGAPPIFRAGSSVDPVSRWQPATSSIYRRASTPSLARTATATRRTLDSLSVGACVTLEVPKRSTTFVVERREPRRLGGWCGVHATTGRERDGTVRAEPGKPLLEAVAGAVPATTTAAAKTTMPTQAGSRALRARRTGIARTPIRDSHTVARPIYTTCPVPRQVESRGQSAD